MKIKQREQMLRLCSGYGNRVSVQPLLAWDSQRSACLCLLSAGVKNLHHHTRPYFSGLFHFVNMILTCTGTMLIFSVLF